MKTDHTALRWWQPKHNGVGDQWALDNIEIIMCVQFLDLTKRVWAGFSVKLVWETVFDFLGKRFILLQTLLTFYYSFQNCRWLILCSII